VTERVWDLLVVGGGINGAGIARDAVGRGLSVLLAEKDDLAGATSSASSKLIHGGLRYLEYGEFRLVREALQEREVLLRAAPHIIWPMRFVLPHDGSLRPRPLIRLGLFLYDHLGGRRTLPGTEALKLRSHPWGVPLQDRIIDGFAYSDCWVQDSRLVVLNARDAGARGATILTRTAVVAARREDGLWRATLREAGGAARQVAARVLVNAAGPWVLDIVAGAAIRSRAAVRLVKGSHVVVPKLYDGPQAYILQNDDRRIVFIIPYEEDFTLIGTTDVPFEGDPAGVAIDEEETRYLCRAVSRWLAKPVVPDDVVWSYAGVRPLYDDRSSSASAVTRDYVFDLDETDGIPALSVFGGKITTYRRLAEHALDKLLPFFQQAGRPWTAEATLPGGDLPPGDFVAELRRRYSFLPEATARRFARTYGSDAHRLLAGAASVAALGRDFGAGLTEREVDWLVAEEWARTAEDILWRRTKLGLRVTPEQAVALASVLSSPLPQGERAYRRGGG
jgi:glycerol-3-phosphate dehydrogenase